MQAGRPHHNERLHLWWADALLESTPYRSMRLERVARGTIVSSRTIIKQTESAVGVKKTGKGRRKLGRKKRRMRARIRHRKG